MANKSEVNVNSNPTAPAPDSEDSADGLKERGNTCVRQGDFPDALTYYTAAIKLNPKDHILFSNRSFVHLKLKQYNLANQDADTAMRLCPTWPKGHFRKAEVMSAVGHYDLALLYYGQAMQLQPGDRVLLQAAQNAAKLSKQQEDYERRWPWAGAGIGIIFGVIIALSDRLLAKKPAMTNPALMVLLVIVIACIGYVIARTIRYFVRMQKKSLLEPPSDNPDVDNQDDTEGAGEGGDDEHHSSTNRTRYTKAQARMRFRKGKS